MKTVLLSFGKKLTLTVCASAAGTLKAFSEAPKWAVEPEGVVTIDPAFDGLSCELIHATPGKAVVSVSGKASFSKGVTAINEQIEVQCLEQAPDSLGVNVGPEEDQ